MTSFRLSRFKRASVPLPFKLTERDQAILWLVWQHRFLRSSQIASLVRESAQSVLRRLQLLYHHGYLERPRAQLDYYHKGGSSPMVYGLGNKGASLLREQCDLPFREVRWSEKNQSVRRIFLEHALLISEVMVAVELACREDGNIRLLTENGLKRKDSAAKPRGFRWRVNVGNGWRLSVIPDRVFALESSKEKGELERAYFFLERIVA